MNRHTIPIDDIRDNGRDFFNTYVDSSEKNVMMIEFDYKDIIYIFPKSVNSWSDLRSTDDAEYEKIAKAEGSYSDLLFNSVQAYLDKEYEIAPSDDIYEHMHTKLHTAVGIKQPDGNIIAHPATSFGYPAFGLTNMSQQAARIDVQSMTRQDSKYMVLYIRVDESDFIKLIDTNQIAKYREAYDDLTDLARMDDVADTDEAGFASPSALHSFLTNYRNKKENPEDPNQMQLDLSKVNTHMSDFDNFCDSILEGLDSMGTGGMATRAKSATPKSGGFGNTSVSSGGMGFQKPLGTPQQKPGVNGTVAPTPEEEELNLNNAITANDHQTVGNMLKMKLMQNPQYFQSPEFQKNQNLKKWTTNPQNSKLITSMLTQPLQ